MVTHNPQKDQHIHVGDDSIFLKDMYSLKLNKIITQQEFKDLQQAERLKLNP